MPAKPAFRNDKLEQLFRKCIVFPADGSETRLVRMFARTVTEEDNASMKTHNRCVDLANTFGDDLRKTRVQIVDHKDPRDGVQSIYLIYYNLSPNLPINLNIAHLIGVTSSHLKSKKRLFWRGDVVVMNVQPKPEFVGHMVECLDADLFVLEDLQGFLRNKYQKGILERMLHEDKEFWDLYVAQFWNSSLPGPPESYWGSNAVQKEENDLQDLNELRCVIGRPPLPRPVYVKSYTEQAVALFKSAFYQKAAGPPKLPPQLERQIFEICALENPQVCTNLMLVARRVHAWLDPILIATVFLTNDFKSKQRGRLQNLLVKLTNGKPVEYAQHVKNLAISGGFLEDGNSINHILSVCTGVENLLLLSPARGLSLNFSENPQAGRNLRRLTIDLMSVPHPYGPMPDFYHPCFANLTHLHIYDEYWSIYTGWENLTSLTHFALAFSGTPDITMKRIQTLPTVRYVALGSYSIGEDYTYADPEIDNSPHMRAAWGVRVVFFSEIPVHDWERGARGEGDFWDLVEREVERRLKEPSVD